MVIDMNDAQIKTLAQVAHFLVATDGVTITLSGNADEKYAQMGAILERFDYRRLKRRADRSLVLAYLRRISGYSTATVKRVVALYAANKPLARAYTESKSRYRTIYTPGDVALLAQTDRAHELNGAATVALFRRQFHTYGDMRFERLSNLSVSHLYNLRRSAQYRATRGHFTHTRSNPKAISIGVRKAPTPSGKPGFIRIDSVHQGDYDGVKGVYYINALDSVTQWQITASVERIGESFLLPVLQHMLDGFPFVIKGFHSDNGSEYVNQNVAALLEKLRIEFTKSRPRHSNDNALVESKNAAVIRKTFGYAHIPQHFACAINAFCTQHLNPYLNLHRPCLYAVDTVSPKGKIKKTYPAKGAMTPLEKLASIESIDSLLKPGVSIQSLTTQAMQLTDLAAKQSLNHHRNKLFALFKNPKPKTQRSC